MRGPFSLQVSVQTNDTAKAIAESIGEIAAIRGARPVTPDELGLAVAALTRGWARNFETADQLASFSLLFGYADMSKARTSEVLFWVEKVAGLLATTFAITMGAPFWFQLLQKLVNLRGAGPKPISQSDSLEAVKQQKIAAKT